MKKFLWGVALLLMAMCCFVPTAYVKDKVVKVPFELSITGEDYYTYIGDFNSTFGTKKDNSQGTFSRELCFKGDDVNPKKKKDSVLAVIAPARAVVMSLMNIKKKSYKVGKKKKGKFSWKKTVQLKFTYTFEGPKERGGIKYERISGSATVMKHPMLAKPLTIDYDAFYNPHSKLIEIISLKAAGHVTFIPTWFSQYPGFQTKVYQYSGSGEFSLIHGKAKNGMPMSYTEDAIDMGAQCLLAKQMPKTGSWGNTSSVTAFVLTALLKSRVPPENPQMLAGLDFLLENDGKSDTADIYSPNTYTYGIVCLYAQANQVWMEEHLDKGKLAKMKAIVASNGKKIEAAFDDKEAWGDMSRNQYAVLGLFAAVRTGWHKPNLDILLKALEYHLNGQDPNGKDVDVINKKREKKKPKPTGNTGSAVVERDAGHSVTKEIAKARGWGYREKEGAYGSMTCGAIGTISFLRILLEENGKLDKKLESRIKICLRDAKAWLQENFTVKINPGGIDWHMYYLYGMERGASMAGWDFIGEIDWYEEGAYHLMRQQAANGAWTKNELLTPNDALMCYPLLFFKRSALSLKKSKTVTSSAK